MDARRHLPPPLPTAARARVAALRARSASRRGTGRRRYKQTCVRPGIACSPCAVSVYLSLRLRDAPSSTARSSNARSRSPRRTSAEICSPGRCAHAHHPALRLVPSRAPSAPDPSTRSRPGAWSYTRLYRMLTHPAPARSRRTSIARSGACRLGQIHRHATTPDIRHRHLTLGRARRAGAPDKIICHTHAHRASASASCCVRDPSPWDQMTPGAAWGRSAARIDINITESARRPSVWRARRARPLLPD